MKQATILVSLFALAISAGAQSRGARRIPPTARPGSHAVSSVTQLKAASRPSAIPGPVAVNGGKKK